MTPIHVVNHTRGTSLGAQIRIADRFWTRTRGLLFSDEPAEGEGLLLSPCQGVHMFFMRYSLDVAFLDQEGRVVAAHRDLRPWRSTPLHRAASHALELPVGTLASTDTRVGDRLSWGPAHGQARGNGAEPEEKGGERRRRATAGEA